MWCAGAYFGINNPGFTATPSETSQHCLPMCTEIGNNFKQTGTAKTVQSWLKRAVQVASGADRTS